MMTAGQASTDRTAGPAAVTSCYVYGIVPSGAAVPHGLPGVGDPPAPVALLPHRLVAAVISEVPAGAALGTAAGLRAHARVVNTLAASVAVLPMRFGALVADQEAVVAGLLAPHHDGFAARLGWLDGHQQFTVKARYAGDAALRAALLAEPEAQRLRDALRGRDAGRYRPESIRLGELVARAMERNALTDLQVLMDALAPHAAAAIEHAPSVPDSAGGAAFLVAQRHRPGFENAAERLGERWRGRIRLRLLGPVAPYDFAGAQPEEV
jgi:hypothetical protein